MVFFPEDYPPLFWHDEREGIIEQTLAAISERSHFLFERKLYPFNRLIQHVAEGKLDLEAWTSPAWRQSVKDKVYFTEPFTRHCEIMVFLKDKPFHVESPKDLIGKKVGTVQGFTFPSYTDYFDSNKIQRISGNDEEGVLHMLKHGRSELAFMDELAANYLLKQKQFNSFESKNHFDCVPITFMFNKEKETTGKKINEILLNLKQEGIIEKIKNNFSKKQ